MIFLRPIHRLLKGWPLAIFCLSANPLQAETHVGHHHQHGDGTKMPFQQPAPPKPATNLSSPPYSTANITPSQNRDSHAYSDGYDFSKLPKPLMGDSHTLGMLLVDRLEAKSVRDRFSMTYDWQAWYGSDDNRVVVRAEGEIDQGQFQDARNELLWGYAISPYWDSHLGVRYDSGLGADRLWGVVGLQGLAPYWVYVEATAYIGEQGRLAFRLETEYDLLITQKLVLQPRMEVNFYNKSDPTRLVSSGLSNIEAGLRLRYEIKREFAPYIGIEWASTFGSAADIIRSQKSSPEETRFVAGIAFWF